jgi:hypothetical protein
VNIHRIQNKVRLHSSLQPIRHLGSKLQIDLLIEERDIRQSMGHKLPLFRFSTESVPRVDLSGGEEMMEKIGLQNNQQNSSTAHFNPDKDSIFIILLHLFASLKNYEF